MRVIATTQEQTSRSARQRILVSFFFLVAVATAGTVMAQQRGDDEKPRPRPVTLKTKDGLELRAFYFPSDKEKKAVTVLIVHEWQGQASPYASLVKALNEAGCAVLVPDYRGHGGSRDYVDARGKEQQFNLAQMSKRDIENIIAFDLEKAKSFLREENDEGLLNLNALVVIGIREGCVLATHWAQRDWSFPSIGRVKQGQDVKALVLISPKKQIKGVGIDQPLRDPNLLRLPIMIVAGETSPEAKEAERLGKRISSIKKRIGAGEMRGFEQAMPKTKLSGAALVAQASGVIASIVNFVNTEVSASEDDNPWVQRKQ